MKKTIKKFILKFEIFKYLYFRFFWHPKKNTLSSFLKKFSNSNKNIFFIQVGANDGHVNDPIYRFVKSYNWSGVVVEPQKFPFEILKNKTYKNEKNIFFENCAIDVKPNKRKLYRLSFSNKRWATGLSSFVRENLVKAIESGYVKKCASFYNDKLPLNLDEYITYDMVTCKTFNDIIKKYDIINLDILIIDVEGFDFEILKMFPIKYLSPSLICFEHSHLSKSDKKNAKDLIKSHDYNFRIFGDDILAIKNNL